MATFDPDLEVNFDLLQVGLDGHIEAIPPHVDNKPRLPLATVCLYFINFYIQCLGCTKDILHCM